ncbi:MAG TPA: hypothetical protein VF755_01220, partial [Catenuloplanes sp.]
ALGADVCAGLAVGYAVEVLSYLPARALGAPRAVLLWPVVTLAAFAVLPGLRRFWRGAGPARWAPVWWSVLMSGAAAFLVLWSTMFYRTHGLRPPANLSPYFDMPFHLALAGELSHRVPPSTPYVLGEPLNYHWFVYAELAATHWATGIELQTLLYRLSPLPMLIAFVVLVAVAASRVVGGWWAGPAAAVVTMVGTVANPYPWAPGSVFDGQTLDATWTSPTNLFGLLLFAAVLLLVIDLVGGGQRGRRPWVLLAVLLTVLAGAKATFLPMLLAGLLLTVAAVAVTTRRVHRPALGAAGLTTAALLFAVVVLFAGGDAGLRLDPLATVRLFRISSLTGLSGLTGVDRWLATAAVLGCALVFWSLLGAGAFGLLRRRPRPPGPVVSPGLSPVPVPVVSPDPVLVMLVGIGFSAGCALLLLAHPGWSQVYFVRGASPVLAILVVAGLAAAARPAVRPVTVLAAVLTAFSVGIGSTLVVRAYGDRGTPTVARAGLGGVLTALAVPVTAMLAVVAVVGLVLFLARRRFAALRGLSMVLTLVVAMGMGLPKSAELAYSPFQPFAAWRPTPLLDGRPELTADGIAAARWLRAHSRPDDVVATNAHCRQTMRASCDNRHFWVSAYAERRVLVEGWAYTGSATRFAEETGVYFHITPFWDPGRRADNDAVFEAPSRAAVDRLRDRYGVRWLFSDGRQRRAPAPLDGVAQLRFRSGQYAVYAVPTVGRVDG